MRNVALLVALAAVLVALWWIQGVVDADALRQGVARLQGWADAYPVLAPVLYACGYATIASLSLPLGLSMTIGAGALFGFWTGLAVAAGGSTVGATGAMLGARYLLRDWAANRLGPRRLPDGDAMSLLSLRLMAVVPYFVVNLGMGLTRITTPVYFAVSLIGMMPALAIAVNAGTQLAQIRALGDVFSPQVLLSFLALAAIPMLVRIWQRRRLTGPGRVRPGKG